MQWFRACPASKSPSSISAAQTSRQRPWTREHQAQTKGRSMATPGVCRSLESLALRLTQANAPIMPSTEGTVQSGSVSVWYWRQCARASALARVDKANWWGRVASSMCCAKPGGEGSPRQSTRQQPASYPGLTRLEHSFSMSLIPGWRMMTQHLPSSLLCLSTASNPSRSTLLCDLQMLPASAAALASSVPSTAVACNVRFLNIHPEQIDDPHIDVIACLPRWGVAELAVDTSPVDASGAARKHKWQCRGASVAGRRKAAILRRCVRKSAGLLPSHLR